jgi:hypothetical protein
MIQIYINEPQHRRAIQSLFDVVAMTYHSAEQIKSHHDRSQRWSISSWAQNLLDHAEWTWGVAFLWSLRTNPAVLNKQKWYLKPIQKIPLPQRFVGKLDNLPDEAIQNGPWLKRIGSNLKQMASVRGLLGFAKNTATFSAVTVGTAALVGTPIYFFRQFNLYPFDSKENAKNLMEQGLHQMAILDLGCRSVSLAQTVADIDLMKLEASSIENSVAKIKTEFNELVDAKRYLFETAYFYGTSQNLNSEIIWNDSQAQFSFRNEKLTCEVLKGQTREHISAGLINLNQIGRILNDSLASFEKKESEFLIKSREVEITNIISKLKSESGILADPRLIHLINYSEEDINNYFKMVLATFAVTKVAKVNLYEENVQTSKLSKLSQEGQNILSSYLDRQEIYSLYNKLNDNQRRIISNFAEKLLFAGSSGTFNSYLLFMLKNYFEKVPDDRAALSLVFIGISKSFHEEIKKQSLPEPESYIDPLLFTMNLHDLGEQLNSAAVKSKQ